MKGQTGFLAAELSNLGFDPVKAEALTEYGSRLLEKNRVMNLTAITEPQDVAVLHMLDSASLAARLPASAAAQTSSKAPPSSSKSPPKGSISPQISPLTLADVGTGAGFPGLVVAILRPDIAVSLLDPLEKRLNFIQEVIAALGLSNVSLFHVRGEDAGRDPALRETFDVTTARAVADLTILAELCLPLTKVGGHFLPMKTAESGEEMEKAKPFLGQLGGASAGYWDYLLPSASGKPGMTRRIWRIEKRSPTPPSFPRKWAKIKKK